MYIVKVILINILVSCLWMSISSSINKKLYSKVYAKHPGDIYLAGIFSINQRGNDSRCNEVIDQDGLQVMAAAIYGIKVVENRTVLPIKLGILAIDTCQDKEYIIEQSKEFLQSRITNVIDSYTCSNGESPTLREELKSFQNIFGVFGAGNSDVTMTVSLFLKLVKLPQLSYFSTNPILSDATKYPTFFRTIPSDKYTTEAIIRLLNHFSWNTVILLCDDSEYSRDTTEAFKSQILQYKDVNICIISTIEIKKQNVYNLEIYVDQIVKKGLLLVKENNATRVVVTLLKQPIAELFIKYVEKTPNEYLSKVLWIATDSWGGRNWPNISRSNSLLNNNLAVIPRAYNNSDFMSFYLSRLPSQTDDDPWLAYKFEKVCNCQYKNFSKFIVGELNKIEKRTKDSISCELNELACSKNVYANSQQMLYIHYVIDGILAYAYTLKKLIPENCTKISSENCVQTLFKTGALNILNITNQMKNVSFIDSTEQPFQFYEKDGRPVYSLIYFNKTTNMWKIIGNISILDSLDFKIEKSVETFLSTNYSFPLCAEQCTSREAKSNTPNCCWICTKCKTNEIVQNFNESETVSSGGSIYQFQRCKQCDKDYEVYEENNTCILSDKKFMSLKDGVAVSLFIINIMGLLGSLISCCIMIIYWNTPIIKAFGRETSTIILIGTIMSFTMSIIMLEKPDVIFCVLRWSSPGFCSTLCYAAIWTKTNRIARIFGIKFSSKKSIAPRFISPISQVNIVFFITLIECAILAVVIFTSSINPETKDSVFDCSDIKISGIVSIFLIPSFLLVISTIYAFKIRKTPSVFNETRNLNFMNFSNCLVLITCLLLHQILKDNQYSVLPFSLLLTLGGHGNLLGLFYPKIYIILFRPYKNTVQAISINIHNKSEFKSQPSTSISSVQNSYTPSLTTLKCQKCNSSIEKNFELDMLAKIHVNKEKLKRKPSEDLLKSEDKTYIINDEFSATNENENDNKAYADCL